jgi:transposase
MKATDATFTQWLFQAQIAEDRLTAEQRGLLQSAFAFRQRCGDDYYSTRLLSHFLLHSSCGLKVAQIARLLGISRPTASHQQGVSSKEAIQAAQHRMAGRPHGKLLPRYAGPIAEFILTHADATRYDILDFIERTWSVRVSTVALHYFCKKFGLDRATRAQATVPPPNVATPAARQQDRLDTRAEATDPPPSVDRIPATPRRLETVPPNQPVPLPLPPFSRRGRNTRARSC